MSVRIVKWSESEKTSVVTNFLKRPAFSDEAEKIAREVLAEIKKDGNKAITKYIKFCLLKCKYTNNKINTLNTPICNKGIFVLFGFISI